MSDYKFTESKIVDGLWFPVETESPTPLPYDPEARCDACGEPATKHYPLVKDSLQIGGEPGFYTHLHFHEACRRRQVAERE